MSGEREGSLGDGLRFEVLAYSHSIADVFDPATGAATGKRVHTPIQIVKAVDQSSPLLTRVLLANEVIRDWQLHVLRLSAPGVMEPYMIITLSNAMIVDISSDYSRSSSGGAPLELLSFTYSTISWTWVEDGIEAEDDWEAPPV